MALTLKRHSFTRAQWQAWGDRHGWDLENIYHDGSAEFRVPNPDEEQGFEFVCISSRVRYDIDRVRDDD